MMIHFFDAPRSLLASCLLLAPVSLFLMPACGDNTSGDSSRASDSGSGSDSGSAGADSTSGNGTSSGGTSGGGGGTGSGTGGVSTGEPGCTIVEPDQVTFTVTDAMQESCYNQRGNAITCPADGVAFSGQDAQYSATPKSYSVCEGIVTDLKTGLMWEQAHHDERVSYSVATANCEALDLGGYTDWRIPSIRELFSLNDARGDQNVDGAYYLDGSVFEFAYPTDVELTGSHIENMMGQTWSSTPRPDDATINYFYNFLDGHIKSQKNASPNATLFHRCVRGDAAPFEVSEYTDNADGTITDDSTSLMWQQSNGEQGTGDYQFSWEEALGYCEGLSLAGHTDWRLPDINELQSLVYYDNPDFSTTRMVLDTDVFEFNLPAGKDLTTPPTMSPPDGSSIAPFFWSSTTHGDAKSFASYICFGPCWAISTFAGTGTQDAHGPGAQRSDPKSDPPTFPASLGDQLDVAQVDNFVRCVR